ncbi:MAG: tetratricopeptide repeat protein [Saccharothrix sp.]|nr:tetratricopeptide repeat protein [Saccharothrix sp.]
MVIGIGLLGEIAVRVGGRPVDPGPARQRLVLAVLAVEAGRAVPVERLAERVWGAAPPRRPRETLHSYVSRLRQVLAAGGMSVQRRSGGYALVGDSSTVDLHRFRDLCGLARAAAGDDERVEALLAEAVALWRGAALTGVDGEWAAAERDRLRLDLLAAELDLTDARLRLGAGEELVAQLAARTDAHPLDERVAAQYMRALYRAGRAADALEHYRRLRERLVEDLGTDPGEALRRLHRLILVADPALTASRKGTPVTVPRQLPAAPAPFVGRDDDLRRLDTLLDTPGRATALISALGGGGGIGKTWLALHWAHHHADRFPDGQLFVDLRGFSPDGDPLHPAEALRGFLDALGVDPGRVPTDLDARAALYRGLVAGKRVLVVLDNAATTDQVLPLLPGTPTCAVLVTGRTKLAALIDRHGARHVQLDVLSRPEARALLGERLGHGRVTAEPGATDDLVELCGRYPLALSITARHAATRARVPLAEFAAELRDLGLDVLDHDDPAASLPAVLSWSLRDLRPDLRQAFALVAIAPGPDIDLPAAAALTGLPEAGARRVLHALEDASLLDRHPHGRYAMHDLVRAYAATTARDELPDAVRRAALERVVDFYLHTAHTADRLLDPHRAPIRLDPPAPGVRPSPLPDNPAALAWLDGHHPHLVAAQHTAAAHHRHAAVWHLARGLTTLHWWRAHRHDEIALWQAAADAAPSPAAAPRILAHRRLGNAHTRFGWHEQAVAHLHQALALAEHHHDPAQQARTHRDLAWAWQQRGDDRRALEHAHHALRLHRALAQPAGEADALNAVGWYAARLGDYDTARDHCRAALTLYRHHDDSAGEAATRYSLGYIEYRTGRHRQALHHYEQAARGLLVHRTRKGAPVQDGSALTSPAGPTS